MVCLAKLTGEVNFMQANSCLSGHSIRCAEQRICSILNAFPSISMPKQDKRLFSGSRTSYNKMRK